MNGEPWSGATEFLASVQPVVLVGGKSTRFGRDKLCEPWGNNGVLVQRPIDSLRAVFGSRVKLVGKCNPNIIAFADGVIPDDHPGVGPIGGIISALRAWGGSIFVLAGDMPCFAPADAWRILKTAADQRRWLAVLAWTDRSHPCAGMYSAAALPILATRLASGNHRLSTAIPECGRVSVPVDPVSAANVNVPAD